MERVGSRGGRAAALLLLALVAAGCAGASSVSVPPGSAGADPSATSAALPSGTASADASDLPAGTPSASDGNGDAMPLCATDQQPCPLEPGTYTTSPFEPEFTFTVEDGWTNDRLYRDGGQVSRGEASFVWASSVSVGMFEGAEVEIAQGVEGFLAHLGRFEGFDISEAEDVTIDGVTGTQVDVTTNEAGAPGLYQVELDRMNLAPGEKARFFLLDKDGETVILIIDAWNEADFDAFLGDAQPLVDSIRWR